MLNFELFLSLSELLIKNIDEISIDNLIDFHNLFINKEYELNVLSYIFKEKIKLIESLNKEGVAIINNDCDILKEYDYKDKRVINYGIKNPITDISNGIDVKFFEKNFG